MSPEKVVQAILRLSEGMSRPVYRGQADESWRLESGALRRLRTARGEKFPKDEVECLELVDDYHKNHLLMPIQVIDENTQNDLQRLSVLQHYGAATGLLDFTENPLVALWFACTEQPGESGKVFVLDIGKPQYSTNARLSMELMKAPFGQDQRLNRTVLYYEPSPSLGARIIAQWSVFVVGNPYIPNNLVKQICLPQESKGNILDYLGNLGLSESTLFKDIPGLAVANAVDKDLPFTEPLSPEQYQERGNRAYQSGRLNDALAAYESYAEALPDVAQPYCLKGDTLVALGRFDEANVAYTNAIKNLDRPLYLDKQVAGFPEVVDTMSGLLFYNRGNVRAAIGDHPGAAEDFGMALQHGVHPEAPVLHNRGNSWFALEKFGKAHNDFTAAWEKQAGSKAALGMGNCKVMVGAFEEALQHYLQGSTVESDSSAGHCQQNAEQVQQLLQALKGADYQIRREQGIVFVETENATGHFRFAGNRGNTGNIPSGMVGMPGGKGYQGGPGFAVIIIPPKT